MSDYQRPWWLLVNRPSGLVSTVAEETRPHEQIFIIRGEPFVQGLAWLTWGPAAALAAVLLLTALVLTINVREQPALIRALVIAAFLSLPALVWVVVAAILNRLSRPHLQAERQAGARFCHLRLNQARAELAFHTSDRPREKRLAYQDIHQAKLTQPIGNQSSQAARLTLDTTAGPLIILDESLGTQAQKIDLAYHITQALKTQAGSAPPVGQPGQ